ncbi:hypothetical protein WJX72_000425 [[Myrmecia] bisecta]|uniref:GATA-type domain-containing protein n=1 Tax=[Myrmecia] bisecta TaxID=41462 RepID=A0AAW1PSY6_9CHLO
MTAVLARSAEAGLIGSSCAVGPSSDFEGVCEGGWWDELLQDPAAGTGPQTLTLESEEAAFMPMATTTSWDEHSSLEDVPYGYNFSFPEQDAYVSPLPCMALELEKHAKEIEAQSKPPQPTAERAPTQVAFRLQGSLSSTDITSLTAGKPAATPTGLPSVAQSEPSTPFLTKASSEGEAERRQSPVRPNTVPLSEALLNAQRVDVASCGLESTSWRGCKKGSWCTRENRHRGLCNTKASIPGLAAYSTAELAAVGMRAEDMAEVHSPEPSVSEETTSELHKCKSLGEGDSDQGSAADTEGHFTIYESPEDMPAPVFVVPYDGSGVPYAGSVAGSDSDNEHGSAVGLTAAQLQKHASMDLSGVTNGSHGYKAESLAWNPEAAEETDFSDDEQHVAPARAPFASQRFISDCDACEPVARLVPCATSVAGSELGSDDGTEDSDNEEGRPSGGAFKLARLGERRVRREMEGAESDGVLSKQPLPRKPARAAKADSSAPAGRGRKRMVGGTFKVAANGCCAPGQQCTQCGTQQTPVWRAGPMGPKTLCNACGVRYMKSSKRK